uniref:C2H2-type domain-containing protein n=1 Tax=Setaria digitata TaxID=48799 RepID=A0A915PC51_9BILA
MDTSNGLTCICCQVVFANSSLQREHYKTDWHRYNLKRKITGFPVVTEEQFRQKIADYKKEMAAEKSAEIKVVICKCCSKQFQSTKAYDNHLSSKKHKESEVRMAKTSGTGRRTNNLYLMSACSHFDEEDSKDCGSNDDVSDGWITDDGSEDFDESKGIPITVCLFCNYSSNDVGTNLMHMTVFHGFFLPDAEFCTDVGGMLHYLGLKVGSGNMCLVCNERKKFFSLDACQKHMRDKGHCRIAHSAEEMIEYEDFYDYSSMYPKEDNSNPYIILSDNGYTLSLPSGARIGHRSLVRYYRQRLKPVEHETKDDRERKDAVRKAVIDQYKQLGWKGTSGIVAVQRARDIKYMKQISSKNWVKLGLNNSKLFKSRGRSDQ